MNPTTRPIKPRQKTEREKLESTAFKLKNRVWEGYHEREIEDHKVTELTNYLLEMIEKWARIESNKIIDK